VNGIGMLEAVDLEASFLQEDACRVCADYRFSTRRLTSLIPFLL
jgi:hypothetical protein